MKHFAPVIAALALAACAALPSNPNHPEARAYTVAADNTMAAVDTALAAARASDKHVLIALGANWCHDSRAFAGWMETPRFAALLAAEYELVYVDAGKPQNGDTRALAVARRFGIDTLEGTPTVLVLDSEGALLNADTAKSWRNAASRSEDAIYDELAALSAE